MARRILAIFIDAFRHDFLSERYTPFLYSLGKQGFQMKLHSILGYSDAIRAAIFTGTYPDTNKYWMTYRFTNEDSPFKPLKILGFIDKVPSDFLRRSFKFVLSATLCKILSKTYNYSELSLHNLPFKIVDLLDMSLRRSMLDTRPFNPVPTLFDILRSSGVKFAYLDTSKLGSHLFSEIKSLDQDVQLVFIYIHYPDIAAHWYGLNSQGFLRSLYMVDLLVKAVVAHPLFRHDTSLIVFSDHGMTGVVKNLNLEWMLRAPEFGKDYFFFLSSTMIQFWYNSPKMKEKIHELLKGEAYGYFLSKDEQKRLRIEFGDRSYGDDIFLLKPGYAIFPNFISMIKPKAMHAYHPDHESQLGIFIGTGIFNAIDEDSRNAKIVDIMPTILDALKLEIPITCEGKSLL